MALLGQNELIQVIPLDRGVDNPDLCRHMVSLGHTELIQVFPLDQGVVLCYKRHVILPICVMFEDNRNVISMQANYR